MVNDARGDAGRQSSQMELEKDLEVSPDKDDSEEANDGAGELQDGPRLQDYWTIAGDYLIRHHVAPRVQL